MTTHATVRPIREPNPQTYTCQWCGIERMRGYNTNRKYAVCVDCQPTETAFRSKP